ncbi:MAG: alpha/beta fold hydrolase [Motilibacteraceae bacterium]
MQDDVLDRDGRRVAVRVGGAAEGPLVVYLHGSPSSRVDADWLEAAAVRAGARLASLDRPGYGASDHHDYTFASCVEDVLALADRLGADRFHVLGQSAGGPYALACAALAPDRVVSAAVTGSTVPFLPDTPWWEHLSPEERQGVALIGTDDEAATALLAGPDEEMSRVARELDDDAFLAYWMEHLGPADRALVAQDPSWFLAGLRESQRLGQQGWARDNVVRMGSWSFDLAAIRCPVTAWYGAQDSWATVNWLLQHVPNVSAHVLRDRGHLLAFAEPDLVLGDLLAPLGA